MGQQTLIYSFEARGTVIRTEYTEFKGNFTEIASQCLQKLPASNKKFTCNFNGHTFNYLVESGFAYSVVAAEPARRRTPIAFLGGSGKTSPTNMEVERPQLLFPTASILNLGQN
ncbi:Vesicle-associated membrane protein 725 [Apostasia shenzhenica]|uniref:Vesicle-associated membrane protein 725 n=1 Tax=Apostasia shenzhenica TaxID=1088818 RepID=A0A2H9ZQM1_9ASPA|nr:Vesicle-associated membrane protein 725 [Apostasia shenzhenica]